jgi:hypothetical protein
VFQKIISHSLPPQHQVKLICSFCLGDTGKYISMFWVWKTLAWQIYIFFYIFYIYISYISFLSQIRTLDFKRHMSFSFCFVFNTLKWEVIVRFLIDIGEIVEHHFKYSFIISIYVFSETSTKGWWVLLVSFTNKTVTI